MYGDTLLIRGILAVANVEVFAAEDNHLTHELVRDVLWNGHQVNVAGAVGHPSIMIFGFSAIDELARHDSFCPILDAVHLTNPFHLARDLESFCHARLTFHLPADKLYALFAGMVRLGEVLIELADKISSENRVGRLACKYRFRIRLFSDGTMSRFIVFKIRNIIITDLYTGSAVLLEKGLCFHGSYRP